MRTKFPLPTTAGLGPESSDRLSISVVAIECLADDERLGIRIGLGWSLGPVIPLEIDDESDSRRRDLIAELLILISESRSGIHKRLFPSRIRSLERLNFKS